MDLPVRYEITLEKAARRIDRALAAALPLSRTSIRELIEAGRVTMDGAVVVRASQPVAAGAGVTVDSLPKRAPSFEPEEIPISILYEDAHCLVVDKPAGLVVHPAPGHATGTLVNALLHHRPAVAGVGSERKAGLVHRLDKDTSGCLLVAKDDAAHGFLSHQFAERTVVKTYWGFTWGHLDADAGMFEAPIGRSRKDRQRMSTRSPKARPAVTRWRVLERYPIADWLEIALETGRTHQIRVHLSEAGHPVLGDARYGGGPARARGFHGPQRAWAREAAELAVRQALHARALEFDPPAGGGRVRVESPPPPDLMRLREGLAAQGGP